MSFITVKLKFTTVLLAVACIILGSFYSCKDEPFEYELERAGAFSFRLDTFDLVVTDEVVFYMGPQVLHQFGDTSTVLFQRISLEAHGFTPSNKEYWFIVDFDTDPDGNAVGTYTTDYSPENGGISDMRLIIDDDGLAAEYKVIQQINTAYFQVDGQREEERIMKGVFGGFLYQDGNPANKAVAITDGIFKDIYY